MSDNYKTARTLAQFKFLGHTFRVVRRRFNGKHWRKYLTLCYDDFCVSEQTFPPTTDPSECAIFYQAMLTRIFRGRNEAHLRAEIERMITRGTGKLK